MDTLVSESNTLLHSIESFISKNPQLTDLYLYHIDGKEFEALNRNLHECTESFEEILRTLSPKKTGERLLIVNLEVKDLERFKKIFFRLIFLRFAFAFLSIGIA